MCVHTTQIAGRTSNDRRASLKHLREYGPLSPAAAAAAAPYVAVQKFTHSTIIRNIYLLSKLREREFFLPAAARTVLLLSIAFGRCLHKVVVQRFRYIL